MPLLYWWTAMKVELWTHPSACACRIDGVAVEVERPSSSLVRFRYVVRGELDALILPPPAPSLRSNNLWKTTCFEAFLRPIDSEAYRELNFSPSSQWAAYDFDSYRSGMTEARLPAPPDIVLRREGDRLEVEAALSLDLPDEPYRLALAAVIEERDFSISYWAASHAASQPDFHHDASFALELPAASPSSSPRT
jgi:hypothetical protein